MKISRANNERPIMTIGDLCEALADGRIASRKDEEYYVVRQEDLRRFASEEQIRRIMPTNTPLDRLYAAG